MKVYWWQGGLHIEPENKEETAALMMIWQAKKKDPEVVPGSSAEHSRSSEHTLDRLTVR